MMADERVDWGSPIEVRMFLFVVFVLFSGYGRAEGTGPPHPLSVAASI